MNMNPGSDDAVKAGCTCPASGNNHGRGTGPFCRSLGCPIHGNDGKLGPSKKATKKKRLPPDFWKLWRKE